MRTMTSNQFIITNILPYLQVLVSLLATGVALYLGLRDNLKRIEACFVWDGKTNYQPMILIQNMRKKTVVLDRVELKLGRKTTSFDFSSGQKLKDCSFIEAGQSIRVTVPEKCLDAFHVETFKGKRTVKIIIFPKNGKKYVSRQKYTHDELTELFFGYGLFKDD